MTQTIVITSGKGGVGKTNASVNIGVELGQRKYRTCLFDADLGLANVNILLGIQPEFTLDDCIFGDKDLSQIVLQTRFGIDIIPGSSGIEQMANLTKEELAALISSFAIMQKYDYFLIDTSAGIARGVLAFCLASKETIIVITSESTSLTDGYALLKVMALNHYSGTVKILVNKSPNVPAAKETYLRFREVVNKHLNIKIAPAGIILNDPKVEASVSSQEPLLSLYPDSVASQCIKALVDNLLKKHSDQTGEADFASFWQRYFDFAQGDLPSPVEPLPRKSPKKSFQLLNTAEEESGPAERPQAVSKQQPPVPTPSTYLEDKKPEQKSTAPFVTDSNIFELSSLPSPTPLLATGFNLHCLGKLTPELLLEIVSCEPVLLAKALKMSVVPESLRDGGGINRVTSRKQLVEKLGFAPLYNLFCNSAIQRALEPMSPEVEGLVTSFWLHSYSCGILAEGLARVLKYPFPEEAFIAGLIHDIGRLALSTHYPSTYNQHSANFQDDSTIQETEEQLFKMSHGELGAEALKKWQFNDFLVDGVRFHTEPVKKVQTGFDLVKIVYLACRIHNVDVIDKESSQLGQNLLRLSTEQLQKLLVNTRKSKEQLARKFNINSAREQQTSSSQEIQDRFRQQAKDYATLRTVLPAGHGNSQTSRLISSILQAFEILFDIKPALCLFPDETATLLKLIPPSHSSASEKLSHIEFSLSWEKSPVVRSFISGEIKTVMAGESSGVIPLADRQLLRSLGSEGFVSVPLVSRQQTRGIIIFGIAKSELSQIFSKQDRLTQFGHQAACFIPPGD